LFVVTEESIHRVAVLFMSAILNDNEAATSNRLLRDLEMNELNSRNCIRSDVSRSDPVRRPPSDILVVVVPITGIDCERFVLNPYIVEPL
jgi:hypothetical protein